MSSNREAISKVFSSLEFHEDEKSKKELIYSGLVKEIEKLNIEKLNVSQSWEVLRLLLDKFSGESIRLLEEMLNKGIKAIFNDRNYKIKIEIIDNKSKYMRLWLLEYKDGGVIESIIPDGIGGGILTVISFIFQVFLIRIYGVRPFLLLDETFSQLSAAYIPNFMEFLRYLIDEMGFTFLWITHQNELLPYFDKVYEVNMGSVVLKQD